MDNRRHWPCDNDNRTFSRVSAGGRDMTRFNTDGVEVLPANAKIASGLICAEAIYDEQGNEIGVSYSANNYRQTIYDVTPTDDESKEE